MAKDTQPDEYDDATDPKRVDRADQADQPDKAEQPDRNEPVRKGDILGLSDVTPDVEIPQASRDHGGSPQGIDVRERATGIDELTHGTGATGIDMGAAGEGTDLEAEPTRPASEPTQPKVSRAGRKS